jgi:hypothetical protein
MFKPLVLASIVLGFPVAATAQIFDIRFDYTYDTSGWFSVEKRDVLEQAASAWESLARVSFPEIRTVGQDNVLTSTGSYANQRVTWNIIKPIGGFNTSALQGSQYSLKAGEVVIYVGSYLSTSSGGSLPLAYAQPSTMNLQGDQAWLDYHRSLDSDEAFRSTYSSITFLQNYDWYFDADTTTKESFSGFDFYSVALHEIGHSLGVGASAAYDALLVDDPDSDWYLYTGALGSTYLDGLVVDYAHLNHAADSYAWTGSTWVYQDEGPLMQPTLNPGMRRYLSETDLAVFHDLAYGATIPEPNTIAALLGALGMFYVVIKRRRVRQ